MSAKATRTGRVVVAIAAGLLLAWTATPAMAVLIAYEPFIGTNSADLVGQDTGGSGFSGGWTGSTVGTGITQIFSDNDGVRYTDENGNALVQSGYCVGIYGAKTGMADLIRDYSTPVPDTGTYYVSAELRAATVGHEYWGIGLPNSNANLGMAYAGGASAMWEFSSWDDSSGPKGGAIDTPTSAFLVGKIVKNADGTGNDSLTLWVNPILGNESASGAGITATINGTGNDVYPGLSLVSWSDGTSIMGYVADVRLGTTFADVTPFTPVPEPGAIVLLAMGLFGLMAYAWRNRN